MNDKLETSLAYWRSMAPQPKAIVYADAIEARMKGVDTTEMVVDHELENAINRGASIARAKGLTSDPAVVEPDKGRADKPSPRKTTKGKRTS